MSPLLVWALRFVTDYADDILAGFDEAHRLYTGIPLSPTPGGQRQLRRYADQLAAAGRGWPRDSYSKDRPWISSTFIAGTVGVSHHDVETFLRRHRHDLPIGEPAHLDVPVRGLLAGQPWVPALSWDDATTLARHLQTACLIVITYLTGMRAEEVLHLESGCHRVEPIEGSTAVRHLIRGRHFKSALDADGTALPRGEYRADPWVTIPPVGAAIAVAERLSVDGVLFSARRFHNPRSPLPAPRRPQAGRCLTPAAARDQIERFIHHANHLADTHHRPAERIPPDPAGPITLRRFRRTLAWFIHRLPRGQIALGVQYGHLATLTGDGYAARAAAGLHNILDVEEALALADTLTAAADRLTDGETVSGPAVSRYRAAVQTFQHTYAGQYLSKRQQLALLANPQLRVLDHPDAALACVYDPTRAMCHPDRTSPATRRGPSLDRRQTACGNIARTDTHIAAALTEADAIDGEVATNIHPQPINNRLRHRAADLRALAATHHVRKVTAADER